MEKINLVAILLAGIIFASCSSSQKFHASITEDKPLFAAINELNKRQGNVKAQKDLQEFYRTSVDRHEDAIAAYKNSSDEGRWDKIIKELNALQNMYSAISATPGTSSLVNPKNYFSDLQKTKEEAAADFYNTGASLL
jgi:outer membrane murein-binding lipoprotein Lpp